MVLYSAVASTIGTAKGGVTSGLAQTLSSPDPYFAPPRPPKEKIVKKTPGELAVQFADGVKDSSFGNPLTKALYLRGLFQYEYILGKYDESVQINIYGDPVEEGTPLTENEIKQSIEREPNQTGLKKSHHYKGDPFYNPRQNLQKILSTPVKDKIGFYDYAADNAARQSSCGMFLRACFFSAGCNNRFFLSLYPHGLAISFLIVIGALRNYRWVAVRDESGNITKRGLMDDYYDTENEQYDGLRNLLNRLKGENHPSNTLTNELKGRESAAPYEPDNFLNYWLPDGVLLIDTDKKTLEPYLKPFEERAIFYSKDIQGFNDGSFPSLKVGDGMIIIRHNNNYNPVFGTEHALLITTKRNQGYKTNEENAFIEPFYSIEGGSSDAYNMSLRDTTFNGFNASQFTENKREGTFDFIEKTNVQLTDAIKQDIIKQAEKANFDNKKPVEFKAKTNRPWPTAILPGVHDIGQYQKVGSRSAFLMGENSTFINRQDQAALQKKQTGKSGARPAGEMMVYAIFKVDSYCDPIENGNEGTDHQKSMASKAIQYMDNLPFIKKNLDVYYYSPSTTVNLAARCFKGLVDLPSFAGGK